MHAGKLLKLFTVLTVDGFGTLLRAWLIRICMLPASVLITITIRPSGNISGDILWVIRMTSTSYESFWSLRKFKTFYGICRREESFVVIIIISWLTVKLQKLLLYSQEAIKVTSKRNIPSLCVYSCEYFLFPLNKLFHIFQDEKLG